MCSEGYTTQEALGTPDDQGVGYKLWGRLSVWIPRNRVRGSRDVIFYEGPPPCCLTIDPSRRSKITTRATDPVPKNDNTESLSNSGNERSAPPPEGRLTVRVFTLVLLNSFRR